MSDIALMMNGLLGVLLVGALFVGWRLEGRLKALKASHQSFAQAVEDLDRAASRAEQGLADLRAATDEAAESLAGRIERAKLLSSKLERLTEDAAAAEARLAAMPRPAPARETPSSRDTSFSRLTERYGHAAPAASAPAAPPTPIAPARTDLILEDEPQRPSLAERLERLRSMARPSAATIVTPIRRSARADDELFEAPEPRLAMGGGR